MTDRKTFDSIVGPEESRRLFGATSGRPRLITRCTATIRVEMSVKVEV